MGCAGHEPPGPGKRLIADERLRNELELCDRWGIPHSQFRGIGNGTWTDGDRAKALAWREYQRTICDQCGTRYDDWDHGGPDEEDQYVASVQRCVGCQVIADKQEEVTSQGDPHGKKIALIPVEIHAAQQIAQDLKDQHRRRRDRDNHDD